MKLLTKQKNGFIIQVMKCNLCPKKCNKDRSEKIADGSCKMPTALKIAHYELFGLEEPCISVGAGSGAIFFSGCNLDCVFCQNHEISAVGKGKFISVEQLAQIFKELEDAGAENINLISPMHYAIQIVEALKIYKPKVPVIYNTNAYEDENVIKFVAPYVDVFLPDFKYFSNDLAYRFSGVNNYYDVALRAIKIMRSLKSDVYDNQGKILSGVIIRHMILPLCTQDSIKVLQTIKRDIPNTKVSLLSQYTPYADAKNIKAINRKITLKEYNAVLSEFNNLGLDGYAQKLESSAEKYIPNYNVMGVAKAALEASVHFLAFDLGQQNIRVNAISAGPLRTLAAAGIGDFRNILEWNKMNAALRKNITIDDVGQSALYLLSDMSSGVTAEVLHVDSGIHKQGMINVEKAHEIADLLNTFK